VAKLVPYTAQRPKRSGYGAWKGRVWIADDFDDPLPREILDAFYSESDLDQ
jgi:antitoxin (DNA-binding transcriptional repressor) of toxin-antitoxin stability system